MIKTTVQIDGMACSMCEAHINDAIRKAFPVKKVTSSHTKKESVILSDTPIDPNALRAAIDATGYIFLSSSSEPYVKKRLFGF